MIDLNQLLIDVLQPTEKEGLKRFLKDKDTRKKEFVYKRDKGQLVKNFLKTAMWTEVQRPKMISVLKEGFARILKDGLTLNEVELKNVISGMRANIESLGEMKYLIEEGDRASIELTKMEQK